MYTKLYSAQCPKNILIGFLLIASGVVCASPAQAQLDAEFGVQVGRTLSTVTGEGAWSNADRRSGWMLAGTARIPLTRHLALQTDAAYVQRGARGTISTDQGPETVTMQTDYIEFPMVMSGQWPGASSTIAARGFAGPAVGFNVSAKYKAEQPLPDQPDLRDQVRRTTFSAVVGLGVDLEVNYQTVTVDAQYQLGLTEVLDTPATSSLQHRGVSVAMGVMF